MNGRGTELEGGLDRWGSRVRLPISFDAVGHSTTVFTETHTDAGDFFSADGVFQFRKTFHETEHLTVTDGVVRVELDHGHFHFFGDC
jgi:hypothetical protein